MKIFIVALLLAIGYAQTERRLLGEAEGETEEKSQCTNEFSKQECRAINNHDLCPAFYDKCQKKCGCFSDDADLAEFRMSAGIDDSMVLKDEQCLPNNDATFTDANGNNDATFADANGFGCSVYEGAGWCNGQGEYGERWCDWFPKALWQDNNDHWCKIKKGRHRMSVFEAYSEDGIDARSCCCDGNLFQEYKDTYEKGFEHEETTCEDYKINDKPWHDDKGWNCAVYHYGELCTSEGERGPGWKNQEWGTLQQHAHGKYHAKTACCACGGGHNEKHWAVLPFNLKRLDKFVQKDFYRKNINRAKRHISSLKAYIEDNPSKDWDPVVVQAIDTCLETVGEGKPNQETTWQALQECWAEFSNILVESDGASYPFLKE